MAITQHQRIPFILFLLVIIGCEPTQNQQTQEHIGKIVPEISLVPLETSDAALVLSGKITLLNFWGTWCPPCRRELPGLARLSARLSNEPRFQLIAVSCGGGARDDLDQLRGDTAAFLTSTGIEISPWADPSGVTRLKFSEAFGFGAYPTTYLIGHDQRVLAIWTGYSPSVETQIAQAVARSLRNFSVIDSL
jgi:thiol-disulfide isomerase/thioredoxin